MSTSSPPPPSPASPDPEPVTPPPRVAAADPAREGPVRASRTSSATASPEATSGAGAVVPLEVPAREDGDPLSFQRNATAARLAIERRLRAGQRLN